jgi:23S rRNA pseudouridine2605 synthase
MDATEPATEIGDRLQKVLAAAGIGSRRECEALIEQGRVTVDGQIVRRLGVRINPLRQQIAVDGERIRLEQPVYYVLNKPRGFLTTNYDPSGRPRVIDLVGALPQRLFSVGRLDRDSEGLMILTNDGELTHRLTHPRFGVPKTYVVQVAGRPAPEHLARLRKGIHLAEGKVSVDRVRRVGTRGRSALLEIVLSEGRNREIRRMLARLGHKVLRLTRRAIGPITDRGLRPGQYRKLRSDELESLRRLMQQAPGKAAARLQRRDRPSSKITRPQHAHGSLAGQFSSQHPTSKP